MQVWKTKISLALKPNLGKEDLLSFSQGLGKCKLLLSKCPLFSRLGVDSNNSLLFKKSLDDSVIADQTSDTFLC